MWVFMPTLNIPAHDLAHKTTIQQWRFTLSHNQPIFSEVEAVKYSNMLETNGLKKTSLSSWKATTARIAKRDATSFATSLEKMINSGTMLWIQRCPPRNSPCFSWCFCPRQGQMSWGHEGPQERTGKHDRAPSVFANLANFSVRWSYLNPPPQIVQQTAFEHTAWRP